PTRLDDAYRTRLELQNHRSRVLDFDLFGEDANLSRHGIDPAHDPDCKIGDMNAKIEHRAATCFRSRREPLLSRRPGLGSAVRKARANEMGLANRPARDGILDSALDSAEALLHRDHQHPPSLRRRIDHLARGSSSGRHRLFHEHVRARAERLYGKFAMQIIRCEDSDRIWTLARQHLVE